MIAVASVVIAVAFSFTVLWESHRGSIAILSFLLAVCLIGRWPLSWQRALGAGLVWLCLGFVPPLPYVVGPGLASAGVLVIPLIATAYAFRRLQDRAAGTP